MKKRAEVSSKTFFMRVSFGLKGELQQSKIRINSAEKQKRFSALLNKQFAGGEDVSCMGYFVDVRPG